MSSTHTHPHTEPNPAPTPSLKLDRTRDFGFVTPPEQLACAAGEFIPTAYREERPEQFERFMKKHADTALDYKTRCYEQDGFSFDADGVSIVECMDHAAAARARKIAAQEKAEAAARAAYRQAMSIEGIPDDSFLGFEKARYRGPVTAADVASNPNDGRVEKGAPIVDNTFDIPGWAAGRVAAQWFVVQKAIREQHNYSPANKEQAMEWLREHGVIPALV